MSLTDLTTIKSELGIADADSDAQLLRYISEAAGLIESHCGRSFGTATYTDVFRQRRAEKRLILFAGPVTAVTSVEESGRALTTSDYELSNPGAGFLDRLDGQDSRSYWAASKISVTYTAGYALPGTDGRSLPHDVEGVCIELVRTRWHNRFRNSAVRSESVEGVGSTSYRDDHPGFGLTKSLKDILSPYRRRTIA